MPVNIQTYEPLTKEQRILDFLKSVRKRKRNGFTAKELSKELKIKEGYVTSVLHRNHKKLVHKSPYWAYRR